MPSRPPVALLAALAFLVAALPAAAVGASPAATAGPAPQQESPVATGTPTPGPAEPRAESTLTMRLDVQTDGDARWRVVATFPIRDANDSAAFEELAAEFEADDSPLGYDSFARAATRASEATGREMELRNVTTTSERGEDTGRLVLGFTWSNFARVTGDRLAVGDAFNTTNGTWLPGVSDRTRLVVAPPAGYGVSDAPEVRIVGGAARWDGPYEFDGREPWIVYSGDAPTASDPPTPGNRTVATTPGTGTGTPGGGLSSTVLPAALFVFVAGASAVLLVVYMRGDGGGVAGIGGGSDGGPTGAAGAGGASGDASSAGIGGGSDGGPTDAAGAGGAAAGGATAAADTDAEDDEVDVELLSDEERVERLIDRNGGRMKQATIVKETGWSNAKVSQLLSSMAEEGRVDKLRIGRENLISFPDEDVTDIDSSDE